LANRFGWAAEFDRESTSTPVAGIPKAAALTDSNPLVSYPLGRYHATDNSVINAPNR
jgi:hypothetical protein